MTTKIWKIFFSYLSITFPSKAAKMCSEPHRSMPKQAIFKKSPENRHSVPNWAKNQPIELLFTVVVIHVTKQIHISHFKIFLLFAIFGQDSATGGEATVVLQWSFLQPSPIAMKFCGVLCRAPERSIPNEYALEMPRYCFYYAPISHQCWLIWLLKWPLQPENGSTRILRYSNNSSLVDTKKWKYVSAYQISSDSTRTIGKRRKIVESWAFWCTIK